MRDGPYLVTQAGPNPLGSGKCLASPRQQSLLVRGQKLPRPRSKGVVKSFYCILCRQESFLKKTTTVEAVKRQHEQQATEEGGHPPSDIDQPREQPRGGDTWAGHKNTRTKERQAECTFLWICNLFYLQGAKRIGGIALHTDSLEHKAYAGAHDSDRNIALESKSLTWMDGKQSSYRTLIIKVTG